MSGLLLFPRRHIHASFKVRHSLTIGRSPKVLWELFRRFQATAFCWVFCGRCTAKWSSKDRVHTSCLHTCPVPPPGGAFITINAPTWMLHHSPMSTVYVGLSGISGARSMGLKSACSPVSTIIALYEVFSLP